VPIHPYLGQSNGYPLEIKENKRLTKMNLSQVTKEVLKERNLTFEIKKQTWPMSFVF
jgi:hypothetical protein